MIFFLAGIILGAEEIVSRLMWNIKSLKNAQQNILHYRLVAYFRVFPWALLSISAYFFADLRTFWLCLGLILLVLPVWAISRTLVLYKKGRLKPVEVSDDVLKIKIRKRKLLGIAGQLIMLILWIYSWRHLLR